MFNPLTRRLGNIFVIVALCVFVFSLYRPIDYRALPHFNTTSLSSYLNGTNPFVHDAPSSVECIPISTTTAFKTTRTKSFTQTAIQSVVMTKTVSFTATQSVTLFLNATKSVVSKETQACPLLPDHGSSASYASNTVPPSGQSPEQEIVAKMRAEGIVVIFKTGAQELEQLAIQLGTTLRYLSEQDILFFSDQQGSLGSFLINDALRNVDQTLKTTDPDFKIYRDIREYQRTGQNIQLLTENQTRGYERSGWVLDKYKFIHMVEETFEMRPNAKWYVFIETDSYVFWDNLASWLHKLDSRKPMYLGSAAYSEGTYFAHGGSGYVLSNAAMNKLLGPEQPQGLAAAWDAKMKGVCCGDLALGIALKEQGVEITDSQPLLNGYKPSTLAYGPSDHWCQPVVTMHHIMPHEISSMWRYERRREVMGISNATIFEDLYTQFVEPHLVPSRSNWDNLSHGKTYSQAIQDEAALARKRVGDSKTEAEAKKVAETKKVEDEKLKTLDAEKKKKEEDDRKKALADKEKEAEKQKQLQVTKPAADAAKTKEKEQEKVEEKAKAKPPVDPSEDEEEEGEDEEASEDEGIDDISRSIAAQKKKLKLASSEIKNKRVAKRSAGEKRVMTLENESEKRQEKKSEEKKPEEKKPEEKKPEEKKPEATKTEAKTPEAKTPEVKTPEAKTPEAKTPEAKKPEEKKAEEKKPEGKKPEEPKPTEKPEPVDQTTTYTAAEKVAHESFENCGKVCKEVEGCFQWVFHDKTCQLGMSFRLGEYKAPNAEGKPVWESGWDVERIRLWTAENACEEPAWPDL